MIFGFVLLDYDSPEFYKVTRSEDALLTKVIRKCYLKAMSIPDLYCECDPVCLAIIALVWLFSYLVYDDPEYVEERVVSEL